MMLPAAPAFNYGRDTLRQVGIPDCEAVRLTLAFRRRWFAIIAFRCRLHSLEEIPMKRKPKSRRRIAPKRVLRLLDGIDRLAPHDCRRTCAKLCHAAGVELEQIQFLLGHVSVETTERYLGCKQRLRYAVNDSIGLEP